MSALHLEVPFYSNTPDNFHCFQAALRMVLSYYITDREYTWKELDQVTNHTSDYTWPLAGLIYCRSIGLCVRLIESFDYLRFSEEGYSYLVELLGQDVADVQKKYSNLEQEMRNARDFVKKVKLDVRIPSEEDIRSELEVGRLVVCNVNARILQGREGYTGHFVVVTGMSDDGIWLHDPGLPPLQDYYCPWSLFADAWSYPNAQARNVIAIYSPEKSGTLTA